MNIEAATEKEFLTKYYTMISPMTGWTAREIEVAVAMVMVYRRLQLKKEAQDENTPEEERIDDIMVALKKPEVLNNLVLYLGMPFTSFRNYLTKLKSKRFFIEGTINPIFIPEGGEVEIKIVLKRVQQGAFKTSS